MKLGMWEIIEKRKKLWNQHHSIEKDREYRIAASQYILQRPALIKELQQAPEYLVEGFFVIVDKNQKTVPFFFNKVQQDLISHLNKCIEEYKQGKRLHLKFLLLKGRQQGFTTVITAYQLAKCITSKNFNGMTIADDIDNTNVIFQAKAKYPYSQLPESIKPSEKFNNRKEFLFDKLNSFWTIGTAGKGDIGRSRTINFFHGSEAAFWGSISDIVTGLGEALTKDSIQILESTANGFNEYKDLFDNSPQNTWECLFFVWWDTPEYTQRFESNEKETEFKQKLYNNSAKTEEEREVFQKMLYLMQQHDLTLGQLYWYYQKWLGYIDKEKIKQEYPCTPEEAFLSSGRCVFNPNIIQQHIDKLRKVYEMNKPKRGYFQFEWNDPQYKDSIKNDTIKFIEDSRGYITLYKEPKSNYPYVLGGDTKGEGSDFFAGTVLDNISGERVATLHAQIEPDTYAHQMYCLGYFYNVALIGIEVNFDLYPIKELERLQYPKQYMRTTIDKLTNDIVKKNGFRTDGNTRPLIISKQIPLMRDNIDLFTDITMLQEALTFVYDENMRPDAESGKHDDLLFSDMIANHIREQQTFTAEKSEEYSKDHWTSDMWEDYHNATPDMKKYLERKWGKK